MSEYSTLAVQFYFMKLAFFLLFFKVVGKMLMLFMIGQFVRLQVNTGAYVDSAQAY